ncbi:MAG: polysaccharide biosynthesis/export family protein [Desulfobacca sp.]|uniref:polysaccharide biosynthesis/export family protein n=1 Tax=Desulfobacca sp. TaxID=2067990 RepID=UPI00404A127E
MALRCYLCRTNRWCRGLFVVILLLLVGLSGCGGGVTAQQALTAQALAQLQQPNPNKDLQQQLMIQASQASLADYRDYQVGPEDQLAITVFGQDELSREVRVNGQGEISMPLVGVVKVAGLTAQEIEKRLEEAYGSNYLVNPQITVAVKEYKHQRVAVTGAVERPGSYEIIGPRTLLEVLSLAGGFANKPGAQAGDILNLIRHQNAPDLAKTAKISTVRPFGPKTETIVIDLRRLVSGQAPELNLPVKNGDVIHVPFAGTAYVLGGVRRPGNIPVKENITVSQAVAMAGGIDPILGTNNITIMRFDDQGKPVSINTNLKNIIARSDPDLPLKDNDVVVVNESGLKKSLYIIRTLLPIPSGSYSMTSL